MTETVREQKHKGVAICEAEGIPDLSLVIYRVEETVAPLRTCKPTIHLIHQESRKSSWRVRYRSGVSR